MFRKLKIKFIMTNVVTLTVVLLLIFCGMYFSMKGFLKFQADMILNSIAKEECLNPNFNAALVRYFFIKVEPSGKVFEYSADMTVPTEDVETLKDEVLKRGVTKGKIANNKYKFNFLIADKGYGVIIVFLDYSVEEVMLKPIIFIGTFFGLLSLALVFGISLFLAGKSIRPIKTSWEKQNIFIADASHELRTPLAVVNSNLEIVMENKNDTVGSQGKWLGNIQSELDRMKKLVDDLLFLARANADEEMPKDYFDLSNLLYKIYDAFMPLAQKKDLELLLDNKKNIAAYGNEFRIKQLITILLDNAIKYTDNGGKIELKLESGASMLQLSIRDTGEGIPKEHIGKIFDRFYRVDKSRSRSLGGSGLGLAIAKCIVDEHKGFINVVSEVSKGTEFTISLPVKSNK